MSDFLDLMKGLRALSKKEKEQIKILNKMLSDEEIKEVVKLIKQKKISFAISKLGISDKIAEDEEFPSLNIKKVDKNTEEFVEKTNKIIFKERRKHLFHQFRKNASLTLPKLIAPEIVGMEDVKKAAALQLVSNDRIHLLLLGDPGTGKTAILHSAADLSPISSFGLGSGTTGAGLAVTLRGNEIIPGLLPMAHQGLCAIDELNLMKDESKAALYNAMEKGFITYDKKGKHHRFDADVKILATANPKGDKFVGDNVDLLKKQIPFDPALLTRFHLVFLIRKPSSKEFKEISTRIVQDKKNALDKRDIEFLKEYIDYVKQIKVELPKKFEQQVVNFAAELKEKEGDYLIEISPRIIVGFIRLVKAAAMLEMRKEANQQDIDYVVDIIKKSLEISKART